jgi:septum formation protein
MSGRGRPPAGAGPRLVLASASPRRADLLRQLGLHADVRPAHVDEAYLEGETPRDHVERLARTKAEAVSAEVPGALVIGGDTVVVHDGGVLGKPADDAEALSMLMSLAGRTHEVLSGAAVAGPHGVVAGAGRAEVRFRAFDRAFAAAYVASGEPRDKAGAYGIQGLGAPLVEEIRGDYYTVVGLPVGLLIDLLGEVGWRYTFGSLVSSATGPEPGAP